MQGGEAGLGTSPLAPQHPHAAFLSASVFPDDQEKIFRRFKELKLEKTQEISFAWVWFGLTISSL